MKEGCFCLRSILLAASRHGKSSRGTPRLRRTPRSLQGAPRLALRTTNVAEVPGKRGRSTTLADCLLKGPLVAAVGVKFPTCNQSLIMPELSRFIAPSAAALACTRRRDVFRGSARLWLFSSRRYEHFLLEHSPAAFLMPNVGANRPAEAGAVSLARDSGEAAARQAYTACRSGSG